ncbi:MAG: hypothetical protein AAF543_22815, partial [Pseudomonadota bacterium]
MSKYQDMLFGTGGNAASPPAAEPVADNGGRQRRYRDLLFGESPASAAPLDYRALSRGRLPDQQPSQAAASSDGKLDYRALSRGRLPEQIRTEQQPQAPARETSFLGDVLRGAGDMASFGFADEGEAFIRSLFGDGSYKEELALVRDLHENAGGGYYLGMAGGAAVPGLGIARAAASGATRAGRYALASGVGAAEGALSAAGGAEGGLDERLAAAPAGAAVGASLGAVGHRVGESLTSFMERNLVRDHDRLDAEEVKRLLGLGREQGIHLTPAELTSLSSLKAQQRVAGQNLEIGDDVNRMYEGRAIEQIDPAIGRYFDRISDVEGDDTAGEMARTAARRAMSTVAEDRASQARPFYEKAFAEAPAVDAAPVLARIDDIKEQFPEGGEVHRTMSNAGRLVGEHTDLKRLHGVKRELDQMIEGANLTKKLGRETRAQVIDVQEALVSALDQTSPDYAKARGIFEDLSPGVDQVREGAVGDIADFAGPKLKDVAGKLFQRGKISVREATRARDQLQAADPRAWQAVKRSFLEEKWLEASKQTAKGGPRIDAGAIWRSRLLGDPKQRKILEAVLEPDEFQTLNDLGDVLEATGRVRTIGSDTAQNLEQIKRDEQNAMPLLAKVVRGVNPAKWPEMAAEKITERNLLKNSRRTLEAITSPEGIEIMKELKRATPHKKLRKALYGQWLAQTLGGDSRSGSSAVMLTDAEGNQYDWNNELIDP